MKDKLSRRDFVVKGAVGLGTVMALGMSGLATPVFGGTKEETMPHVSVKLWPGRSEADKKRLAEAITQDVVRITGCSESSVSVSIEDVPSSQWKEKVYDPEIRDKDGLLYKQPGYSM